MEPFSIIPDLGVNLFDDSRTINDRECVRAKNILPFKKGVLCRRPALARDEGASTYIGSDWPSLDALFSPFPEVIAVSVSSTYVTARGVSGGSDSAVFAHPVDRTPALIQHNNSIYCFPGKPNTSPGYVVNAETIAGAGPLNPAGFFATFTFNGTGNEFSPSCAAIYRRRMVYAYDDYIIIADPDDPATIGDDVFAATTGRAIQIGGREGDRIVAMIEITQNEVGSPVNSSFLILKEYSAYILNGEPNYTTDDGDILADCTISRINYDCGCSAPKSLVQTPYGVIWAGWDDVWSFTRGSLPVRIGSKIRPVLQASPAAERWAWQGAYFNGFYRLAVHSPSGTIYDAVTNKVGILGEQWWLDLRDGPPQGFQDARWWGPQIFTRTDYTIQNDAYIGTTCFLEENRPGKEPALYDLGYDGYLYKYDEPQLRDGVSVDIDAIDLDDKGTEIEVELVSKEYDFGAAYYNKVARGIKIDYWTSITQYLQSRLILDGADSEADLRLLVEPSGFMVNADSVDVAIAQRSFQKGYMFDDVNLDNHEGQTIQLKFYDTAGYIIGESNDTVVILSSGTYYTVTLTQGFYDDLKALLDHLVARILAVVGVSCSHDVTSAGSRNATITLTFGGAVSLSFQSGGATSATDLRKSRVLMGMLGWDTSANSSSGTSQVSTTTVYYKQVGAFQIAHMDLDINVLERDLT